MATEKKDKYIEAIGRRKTSTARVRITPSSKAIFLVNNEDVKNYFQTEDQRRLVLDPMVKGVKEGDLPAQTGEKNIKWSVEVHVNGGGMHSQAEAVRHGLSRALVKSDEGLHSSLKSLGFLKRDPRAKERRKFGLKKARKSPQWSKR